MTNLNIKPIQKAMNLEIVFLLFFAASAYVSFIGQTWELRNLGQLTKIKPRKKSCFWLSFK